VQKLGRSFFFFPFPTPSAHRYTDMRMPGVGCMGRMSVVGMETDGALNSLGELFIR